MEVVTCAKLRAAFGRGEIPDGADVRLHVQGCPDCAELFEQDAIAGRALSRFSEDQDVGDLSHMRARLKLGLAHERGLRAWLRSRRTRTRVGLAMVSAAVLGTLGEIGRKHLPKAWEPGSAPFWKSAAACFAYGSLFAAAYLALLWCLDRSERPVPPRAALSALAAGVVGNLALFAHCPESEPWHLLAGHGSVIVVCIVVWTGRSSSMPRSSGLREKQ